MGQLRAHMIGGMPWFIAADVCRILEMERVGNAVGYVAPDEKMAIRTKDAHMVEGIETNLLFLVSETGLYRLIFRAQRPQGEMLRRWVMAEVLPMLKGEGKRSATTDGRVSLFQHPQFGEIRVTDNEGKPWFIAADVCRALGLKNSRDAVGALDDDEKGVASTDTLGGAQSMAIISESGLYALTLRCRDAMKSGTKPHAFRKWVTSEVLPAIRKTGGCSTVPAQSPNHSAQLEALERGLAAATDMIGALRDLTASMRHGTPMQRTLPEVRDLEPELELPPEKCADASEEPPVRGPHNLYLDRTLTARAKRISGEDPSPLVEKLLKAHNKATATVGAPLALPGPTPRKRGRKLIPHATVMDAIERCGARSLNPEPEQLARLAQILGCTQSTAKAYLLRVFTGNK